MSLFLTVFILSYLYHGLGITVGYHRLLSHRSFKIPLWLEYFVVSGGYLTFEGSPVSWVSTHRVHHRYTDLEGDPHRPADGFWHAYAAWLVKPIVVLSPEQIEQVCPDLCRDPVYKFLDFNHQRFHALFCLIMCVLFRVVLFVTLGPWAVVANLLAAATVFNAPFLVNSVCHVEKFGYRNFDVQDDSRNVWWVGLLGLGEGWHNNHHAVPQSARHGLRPNEFDLSWVFISLCRSLGLATNIRLPKGESKSAPIIDPWLAQKLRADAAALQKTGAAASEEPDEIAELMIPPVNESRRPVANASLEKQASSVALLEAPAADKDAATMEQLQMARAQLAEQLKAARLLTAQLTVACDQLNDQIGGARVQLVEQVCTARDQLVDQVGSAREQISDQFVLAREQLLEQLIQACEQLIEQLAAARDDIGDQLVGAQQHLSEQLLPMRHESEGA